VWAYRVTIENHSTRSVKLLSRYWHITDGKGRVEEVRGAGVVGEQPELGPGDSYQYTSGCPLSTPSGIMVGTYTMRDEKGEVFEVDIPAFSLDIPDDTRVVN
jgi:ApaG protein